jgi:hypothetical protein
VHRISIQALLVAAGSGGTAASGWRVCFFFRKLGLYMLNISVVHIVWMVILPSLRKIARLVLPLVMVGLLVDISLLGVQTQ